MWLWARPLPPGAEPQPGVRRVLLSPESSCISFCEHLLTSCASSSTLQLKGSSGKSLQQALKRTLERVDPAATGHFLELCFGAQHLEVGGWHAHNEWVRYIGRGASVACFHVEAVSPSAVLLPPPQIHYGPILQQDWLRQELQELAKVPQSLLSRGHPAFMPSLPAQGATPV